MAKIDGAAFAEGQYQVLNGLNPPSDFPLTSSLPDFKYGAELSEIIASIKKLSDQIGYLSEDIEKASIDLIELSSDSSFAEEYYSAISKKDFGKNIYGYDDVDVEGNTSFSWNKSSNKVGDFTEREEFILDSLREKIKRNISLTPEEREEYKSLLYAKAKSEMRESLHGNYSSAKSGTFGFSMSSDPLSTPWKEVTTDIFDKEDWKAKWKKDGINTNLYQKTIGAEGSLYSIGGYVGNDKNYITGEVDFLRGEVGANAAISTTGISASGFAEGSLIHAQGGGSLNYTSDSGIDIIGVNASGEADLGKVYAGAKVNFGISKDENGNKKVSAKLSGQIGADAASASGSVGVRVADVDVKAKGSVKVGVGAGFEAGYEDGKFSCKAGAALGVGFDVGFEVDVSKWTKRIKNFFGKD